MNKSAFKQHMTVDHAARGEGGDVGKPLAVFMSMQRRRDQEVRIETAKNGCP